MATAEIIASRTVRMEILSDMSILSLFWQGPWISLTLSIPSCHSGITITCIMSTFVFMSPTMEAMIGQTYGKRAPMLLIIPGRECR